MKTHKAFMYFLATVFATVVVYSTEELETDGYS